MGATLNHVLADPNDAADQLDEATDRAARLEQYAYALIERLNDAMDEIIRLRQLAGPLSELIIAYQDADSPAIQDTIRRGRLALTNGDRGSAA